MPKDFAKITPTPAPVKHSHMHTYVIRRVILTEDMRPLQMSKGVRRISGPFKSRGFRQFLLHELAEARPVNQYTRFFGSIYSASSVSVYSWTGR